MILGEAGLHCFGKISASISHEIKNTLAIINENAGLLSDLVFAYETKGMPLDPERIKSIAGKVAQQIQRADGIVKNMNRFAHSIDDPVKTIDLWDIIEFAAALSARFIANRGITLELKPPAAPITITSNPFFLINLVCRCLDYAMDVSGEPKTVGVETEQTEGRASVRFTGLNGFDDIPAEQFPAEPEKAILAVLHGELLIDNEKNEFILNLTDNVEKAEP